MCHTIQTGRNAYKTIFDPGDAVWVTTDSGRVWRAANVVAMDHTYYDGVRRTHHYRVTGFDVMFCQDSIYTEIKGRSDGKRRKRRKLGKLIVNGVQVYPKP